MLITPPRSYEGNSPRQMSRILFTTPSEEPITKSNAHQLYPNCPTIEEEISIKEETNTLKQIQITLQSFNERIIKIEFVVFF